MLKSFTKEYLEYTDGGTFIRYTGQTNGIDIDDFVKIVWAEALRYGASVLPENGICRKHGIGPTGFECVFCADVEGSNATLEDSRSILLEEADKATKNV